MFPKVKNHLFCVGDIEMQTLAGTVKLPVPGLLCTVYTKQAKFKRGGYYTKSTINNFGNARHKVNNKQLSCKYISLC